MASRSTPSPPPSYTSNEVPQAAATHHIPVQKLAALERFKSFTSGFSLKKPKDAVVFPPPSWSITDDEETAPRNAEVESIEPIRDSVVAEQAEAPEPLTLAQRIKTLIDSLPLPAAFAPTPVERGIGPDEPATIPKDDKGPPVPTGVDARLMRLLSSEDVMNGDASGSGKDRGGEGAKRQSVWSALERLRHGRSEEKDGPDDLSGEGVMMYSPLEPGSDSQVELAESELDYVGEEDFKSGKFIDEDQGKDKGKERENAPPSVPKQPVLEKHWVPSTTNLSLFTTWWGYRLYLPPPVMATLDNNHLKATKRAAMITTALQWFLNKIPLMAMPPQVRGAVTLLRRLTPLVGYIGVFVAWSWTRIAACNKGKFFHFGETPASHLSHFHL